MKNILFKYRWIIIPIIPLLFFVIMVTLIFSSNESNQFSSPQPKVNPTTNPYPSALPNSSNIKMREEMEGDVEKRPGLLNKENLPDNTTRYTFTSQNSDRSNIIIVKGTEEILFQRAITPPQFPVKITNYTNVHGSAKWIFKGSNFYGSEAQTYIYPDLGFAYIGNPKTNGVLELHTFQPTTVEEYVSKYGDDILAQP